MNTVLLAPHGNCTACGACMEACPKQAIHMEPDGLDCIYPVISQEQCVACGNCRKVCPALMPQKKFDKGIVYAAWNTDEEKKRCAASGAIATAIYDYALLKQYKTFGVRCSPEGCAEFIEICGQKDIESCRNSKYVFSSITPALKIIKKYLEMGEYVILPALPCQNAAVLSYVGGRHKNLLLVDIICHGVCPESYLWQHIAEIEKRKDKKTEQVHFRDPRFGTENFVFSLNGDHKIIYQSPVHANDVYQLGYHKALNYRENCYQCIYATPERLGDLTIGDFSGLGRMEPFDNALRPVSCVIVSSKAGADFFDCLCDEGFVDRQIRPEREAFEYERQLKAPSMPHKNRGMFVEEYLKSGSYECAASRALRRDIIANCFTNAVHIGKIRRWMSRHLPKEVKQIIREVIKR